MEKKRRKIVVIAQEAWLPKQIQHVEGKDPDFFELYQHLSREFGIDVEIIDPFRFPLNLLGKLHYFRGVDFLRSLKILFFRRDIDAVVSVFESSIFLVILFKKIFRFKPKVIMWDIAPHSNWKAGEAIQNYVVPRLDGILLLSTGQEKIIRERWNKPRLFTVLQHIDSKFFSPSRHPSSDDPILAIGDDKGRDWDLFIKAIDGINAQFVVKTRAKLQIDNLTKAKVIQISERISFKDLRSLYDNCKFVVIPLKKTENVSGVGSILEAMSVARAVVTNENLPILDYVNEKNSVIVPIDDAIGLRRAICSLIDNQEKANQLGKNGRLMVEESFSEYAFAKRFSNILNTMIDSPQ